MKKQKQIQTLREQFKIKFDSFKKLQEQIKLKNQQLNQSQQKIKDQSEQLIRLEQELNTKNQQILKQEQKFQNLNKQNKQLLVRFQKLQLQNNQTKQLLSQVRINEIYKKYDQSITRLFVNSEVIPQQSIQNKQFVFNAFKQTYKKEIFKAQLIYKFDPLNLINFHQYIDGKSNVLLLASTHRGSIVGGFMQGPIASQSFGGFGFIFNVIDKEVYTFNKKNNFKATSYDPYYLIYGNNELRVKTSDKNRIIFSNFGIVNSYFDHRKKNVKHFLGDPLPGQTERQAKFITYEIYTLKFRAFQQSNQKNLK